MVLGVGVGVSIDTREVSHQYEYDNGNEHVIKSFFFVFVMHNGFKLNQDENHDSIQQVNLHLSGINPWTIYAYVVIPNNSNTNNQIVLHFQGEHVQKSKKMNKIMFVWNVGRFNY
jgi:hypothetical protein